MKIFSGSSNRPLTENICKVLGIPIGNVKLKSFASGERFCQYEENIRGDDVFLVQSTSFPANDNLMELLIMADAARRSSASRITAVIPYFGYARQDRKEKSRVPISAKLVMNMLEAAGVQRILTMDLHAPQIGGFTDLPVDHLNFKPALIEATEKLDYQVVVAPDIGATKRANEHALSTGKGLAIIDKKRIDENNIEVQNFVGNVEGKSVLIIDDLTESCKTLIGAAKACINNGSGTVYAAVSHGCFSQEGYDNINADLSILNLFYSNTICNVGAMYDGMTEVDVSWWFATAISNIHENKSVSELFQS